jgi:hypothetical protein
MADLNLNELANEEYKQLEKERAHRRELSDLKSVEPAVSLQKATILVCRLICSDYKRFVKQVNRILSLNITVFHRCLNLDYKLYKI